MIAAPPLVLLAVVSMVADSGHDPNGPLAALFAGLAGATIVGGYLSLGQLRVRGMIPRILTLAGSMVISTCAWTAFMHFSRR